MDLDVLGQGGTLAEGVATVTASIWLLSRVCPEVLAEG